MFPNSMNGVSLSGQDPLSKERNQILLQTGYLIEQQNKIIAEQEKQIKALAESVKKSAEDAEKSSRAAQRSAAWSFVVSCLMGAVALATLVVEIVSLFVVE